MFRKRKFAVLSMLAASILLLNACTEKPVDIGKIESEDGPFGKYKEPVTVTAVKVVPPFVKFAEGEDIENNVWTRAYEEKLGIKVKYLWTVSAFGEAFDQKINIGIASYDVPAPPQIYTSLFMKVKDADMVQDLKGVYEKYASPRLKELENLSDSAAIKGSTFDGKLLAIGSPPNGPTVPTVWVRDDWRKALGLSEPKTIDDVIALARAFALQDPDHNGQMDTYGLALAHKMGGSMNEFFGAYGARHNFWMDQGGKLTYSSTQPEIIKPLKVLAQLYKEGVIDKEFAIKSFGVEVKKDVIAGKVGVLFGPPSKATVDIGDSYKATGAEWQCYEFADTQGQKVKSAVATNISAFTSINKNCKNPEAIIKLMNFTLETKYGKPEWVTGNEFHTTKEGYAAFYYPPVQISDPREVSNAYKSVQEALANNDTSKLLPEYKKYYDSVKSYMEKPSKDNWAFYMLYKPQGLTKLIVDAQEGKNYIESKAFFTETPAWVQSGANLTSKCEEFYTRAVMSGDIEGEYQKYVDYFNQQGGAKATQEVNEANAQYLK